MELNVSRESLEVVEHHEKLLVRVSVYVRQHCPHSWPFHEVAATRITVEKRLFIRNVERRKFFNAPTFLALQPCPVQLLSLTRNTGVNETHFPTTFIHRQ